MERKSRMFAGLRTWNPWFGCEHHCYRDGCWAKRRLAHRFGVRFNCPLCYEFKPHLHSERLYRVPREPRIFVVGQGDLFGRWVPSVTIEKILEVCRSKPKEVWFFETKNPRRYLDFLGMFPKNTVLSTTIETNITYDPEIRGYAPTPFQRFEWMLGLAGDYKLHISIEPIMDFDLEELVSWMKRLKPIKIAVGYDSLHNHLPEPPVWKTQELISWLQEFTDVETKFLR